MLKIGIECESIENVESWGVGRLVKKLLEEIAGRPELQKEFRFFLYFKSRISDYPWLSSPIFVKKMVFKNHSHILPGSRAKLITGRGKNLRMKSFSLYYYIFLPIKLWFEKLDVMFFPNYMLSPLFRGKSLVMLTEDIYHEMRRPELPWRYKLAYRIFAGWWAARHATCIMAISESSKHEISKLFKINPDRIVVNQLGVDKPKQTHNLQLTNPKQILNSKLQIQNSEPITHNLEPNTYILYVGQAFPRRHLRETMLAFELIASKNSRFYFPDSRFSLVAVGYDKYNPPVLKKLAEEINQRLGRNAIIYREYVSEEELAELYAGAKCLVYVSSKEAFGLPPLEALGYGVPAVVADEPINQEIYGKNIFFASPARGRSSEMTTSSNGVGDYTPESIARAIKQALTNDAKREQIKNAAPGILAKYTWAKHTDRFLEIVRKRKD